MAIIAQLTITMDDKGAISVNGPLANILQCYGLLELAKDTIRNAASEARNKSIVSPGVGELREFGKRQ